MASARVGHCIFCDDIRLEIGNKSSFMGVYIGDILFTSSPPVVMPKFGIVAWIISDRDDVPTKLTIRIVAPDGTEIARMEESNPQLLVPAPQEENITKGTLRADILIMNLQLNTAGLLEVIADTERESFRVGRLGVRFNVKPEEMALA